MDHPAEGDREAQQFVTSATASDIAEESSDVNADLMSRKLIKDSEIEVETKNFDEYLASITTEASKSQGYIKSSNIYSRTNRSSGNRQGDFVLRIPADNYDEFTQSISSNALVLRISENVEDITAEYIDTESRINALRTEQESLLGLLETVGELEHILLLQERLTQVRASIESYESQMRTYENLISYSTIHLSVREVERDTITEQQSAWQQISTGFTASLNSIGRGFRKLFIFFAGNLPVIILLGIIPLLLLIRIYRRAKMKRKKTSDIWNSLRRAKPSSEKDYTWKAPGQNASEDKPEDKENGDSNR